MNTLELLKEWKNKIYQKTNYENIHVCFDDQKYFRIKPKSHITLTPGFLHIILKQPTEWVKQNFKLEEEVTLHNETHNVLYCSVVDSLFSDDEKELKLHVKSGVVSNEETWDNLTNYLNQNTDGYKVFKTL
jgi:hypothetical protein|tara:strand:- start:29 stop:421 length:393 start_codon:yes stop_codon:yes gene_type:complete